MAHATLSCPHCDSTLRPVKPVPAGKKVKCPKCGKPFTAPADDGAAAKKPAAVAAAKPDESAATYTVAHDPEEEARKAAEEARKARRRRRLEEEEDDDEEHDEDDDADDIVSQYLKNVKSKDPRGAAQEQVVNPSNWLLRTALLGFFGWAILFIVFMIPVAFPTRERGPDKDKYGNPIVEKKEEKKDEDKKEPVFSLKMIVDQAAEENYGPIAGFVAALLLGLVQACLIAVGSVKMNSLESRSWSLFSSSLAILPLHALPAYYLLWTVLEWILDDAAMFAGLLILLWGPLVGISCLTVLKKPDVRAGYEYRPD